jgi:hypothetical protein
MRRQLVSTAFAGLIGACATSAVARTHDPNDSATQPVVSAPVAVQRVSVPSTGRDEVSMVLLGTALIGLATALRRAS